MDIDTLDAMWEVNRQQIEALLEYRRGGGLERVVETTARFDKLFEEQCRLLGLMIKREEQKGKGK